MNISSRFSEIKKINMFSEKHDFYNQSLTKHVLSQKITVLCFIYNNNVCSQIMQYFDCNER